MIKVTWHYDDGTTSVEYLKPSQAEQIRQFVEHCQKAYGDTTYVTLG
jgi:hypothetical protein